VLLLLALIPDCYYLGYFSVPALNEYTVFTSGTGSAKAQFLTINVDHDFIIGRKLNQASDGELKLGDRVLYMKVDGSNSYVGSDCSATDVLNPLSALTIFLPPLYSAHEQSQALFMSLRIKCIFDN